MGILTEIVHVWNAGGALGDPIERAAKLLNMKAKEAA
jgi:hypothetical protein